MALRTGTVPKHAHASRILLAGPRTACYTWMHAPTGASYPLQCPAEPRTLAMSESSCARDVLFNRLADEFAARYRRGERPPLREYVEKYPELADDIRELFPALIGMERVREDCQEIEPPAAVLPPLEQLCDYRILRE